MHRKSVDLLKLMRGNAKAGDGLKIIKIETSEPDDVTFTFEGRKTAVDVDVLDVPASMYPLRKGDRLLVLPLGGDLRYGAVAKLTDGPVLATMATATSLTPDGMTIIYPASRLLIPPFVPVAAAASSGYLAAGDIRALQAGDRVLIQPVLDGAVIKYAIIQRY